MIEEANGDHKGEELKEGNERVEQEEKAEEGVSNLNESILDIEEQDGQTLHK